MTDRLSLQTLAYLPDAVRRPAHDVLRLRPGMVHIGVGVFHRAHQAVHTDDTIEKVGGDRGVAGISVRSATAEEQLGPQDGLFTVGTRIGDTQTRRVTGNLRKMITAPRNPAAALDAVTSETVSVVTSTITEKEYGLDPATGALQTSQDAIAADLAHGGPPQSALGLLAKAIEVRREAGVPPLTIVSCANLPSNGQRLASAIGEFAADVDRDFARFVEHEIACPGTMVDRIVPATTPEDRDSNQIASSVRDEGYVKTEPFKQWVIEDRFSSQRPACEEAGAMLVPNVAPYENAKLRLSNGAHSAIADVGYLSGNHFVHDVMADQSLTPYVTALMDVEIAGTLQEPSGMPLGPYAEALRSRFRNDALQHRTWQIAMDGSQNLPQRLLRAIRGRITGGEPFGRLATAVAAWIVYASGRTPEGDPIDVRDPLAERFAGIRRNATGDADGLLAGFLRLEEVFGRHLAEDRAFQAAVVTPLRTILTEGACTAAAEAEAHQT